MALRGETLPKSGARPLVEYRRVRKSFGDVEVLKGINLTIAPGEKVAVIGPSGSGKTTLARILMTLEEPDGGEVYVGGEPLWHRVVDGKRIPVDERTRRRLRARIGMVFQHFYLFPHMTVLQNLMEAPLFVQKRPRKEVEKEAYDLLEKVGLADQAAKYPAQLSGGQKQRVAIARALMMHPDIMIFDEPTSALDPELVGEVLGVIRDIAEKDDMAMLLVTHEMQFAREVADRVVFMDGGLIVEEGPAEEVLDHPQTERLQAFLSRFHNGISR